VVNSGIVTTTVKESDQEPHSKWSPGFRIGADVEVDYFDLEAYWTHFNGRADFSEGLQHGHWKIDYDTVDLTIGHTWAAAPCFFVRPFIGVRAAHIHQKLKSHLETVFTSIIGNNTVYTNKNDKEKFWGVGPEIGLDADWYLGCGFSLYGSIDIVSYYGEVKGRNYDVDTFTSTVSVSNGRRKHCFNTFGTDAVIGIRWDKSVCLCGCEADFFAKLGAEQHRIYDFSDLGSDGALSLDGGIFGVGINFRY
jgi:hypothetical protein